MSKLLIIKAHPFTGEASTSIRVADQFITTYKEANPSDNIQEINLYHSFIPEIDEDILMARINFENEAYHAALSSEQQNKLSRINELTQQFLDADKIVVVNPLWNLSVPTRLKAWIDTIVIANATFKYTMTGPVGLLDGKKLLHIQSNGGHHNGQDPASHYIKEIFNFIGVTDQTQLFIEGTDLDPTKKDSIVLDSMKKAQEIGYTF